jgi:para-aminobenzoate synthetase component I
MNTGSTRLRILLDDPGTVNWHALADQPHFLYRRIADKNRAFLFVGRLEDSPVELAGAVHDWCYGHIRYELKEQLEGLISPHPDRSGLPLQDWAVPRWVVEWHAGGCMLHVMEQDRDAGLALCAALLAPPAAFAPVHLQWEEHTAREQYLQRARRFLAHIQRGDIYEVNYCMERTARASHLDPFAAFGRLLARTNAPFAAFHRSGDRFALCASPERFLSFDGSRVTAEPMKGTRPRSDDPTEDARLAHELATDGKERSENIMALDVVRHDLSRVALASSVRVRELCVVRSHGRVHQLVSTVDAHVGPEVGPMDVVRATFPMASMTGAPKVRAMQLIDALEDQQRGLYSGSLGYFTPDGTGDLNVVIRTVLFDAGTGTASLSTGSALTAACDPEQEWEECQVKARSVMQALAP